MFHGSLVALVTPMTQDGAIDFKKLAGLVEWQIEQGTDGLVILGTTGESPTVTDKERGLIIEQVVEQVSNRLPVIIGTGANATQHTIELTEQAMHLGADAALLVAPYYNKPTQEGLYQHYLAVAKAVPIPQILYNVPARTACDILPATVKRLTQNANNIVAIKETCPDVKRVKELLAGQIDVLSGDDYLALAYMEQGAKGVISVTANVAPKLVHNLCQAALAGDLEKARQLNKALERLNKKLFLESNPIPVKWALKKLGRIDEGIRLPLTPLDAKFHADLDAALQEVGSGLTS